jgi:small subunit ribosomal protein S4
MLVKPGWRIALTEKARKVERITAALDALERRSVPSWLELDKEKFEGTVSGMPVRDEITLPIQEQLIVELYSR